jgi:hypothetical protein
MGQVNVNTPGGGGDTSGSTGVNLAVVLIIGIIALVVLWFLFTGPWAGVFGGTTNVTVNPPATAQPAKPAATVGVPSVPTMAPAPTAAPKP